MNKTMASVCVASALLFAGCGSARNIVMAPADTSYRASAIEVNRAASTVQVPDEYTSYFDGKLREDVFKSFARGNGIKLEYRFISFDEGSRFKRYLSGGIGNWGEGTLLIEANFLDGSGKKIGSIETDAVISGGMFGGSFENALDKAAEKLSSYAVANFKN